MFVLQARNLVRYAKRKGFQFGSGRADDCAVGIAIHAVGPTREEWHRNRNSLNRVAKMLNLTPNQLLSFENGYENRPTGEVQGYWITGFLRPTKLHKRYYKMGQNVRRLARENNILS